MSKRSILIFTTGAAGTGKTYVRGPRFLIDEFLPDSSGVHWSNFPFGEVPQDHKFPPNYDGETFIDRIAEHVAKKTKKDADDYRDRIQVIPEDELRKWMTGESGPWDFFEDKDLAGAHVAIDEIHNFCGTQHNNKIHGKWQQWLGEIRHRGATIEFLSQDDNKVAKLIRDQIPLSYELVSGDGRRDPWFGIPMNCWYELRGLFTRQYENVVFQVEYQRMMRRRKVTNTRRFRIDPFYFQFYDSFSSPHAGGASGQLEKHEFEKRSTIGLVWWFFTRNFASVSSRVLIVGLFLWIMSGGGVFLLKGLLGWFGDMAPSNRAVVSRAVEHGGAVSADMPVGVTLAAESWNDERDELQAEIEQLKSEANFLADRIEQSTAVVLITPASVTFRGGYSYRVGELVDYGPFIGRIVKAIDYEKRTVVLDDGVLLRMGIGMQVATERSRDTQDRSNVPPPAPDGRVDAGVSRSK